MQDLEPDMEDLLRRASDAYPLKEGEDKWDDIASRISPKNAGLPEQKHGWLHKRYALTLLLLLILASGILTLYRMEKLKDFGVLQVRKSVAITSLPGNYENDLNKSLPAIAPQENGLSHVKKQPVATHFSRIVKRVFPITNEVDAGIVTAPKFNKVKNIAPVNNTDNTLRESNKGEQPGLAKDNIPENNWLKEDTIIPLAAKANVEKVNAFNFEHNNAVKRLDTLPAKNRQSNLNNKAPKGFYYGAVVGVGLNAIKDQGFKKAGFDAGIITGYRFNNSLSLETGLLFAKKFYWTPGKYFSIQEMHSTMPAGAELTEVHGSSGIVEFPLHVRYDFLPKPHHRFYVLAGFSSYSMMEENNEYYTLLNGVKGTMHGSYKKDRRYFAAAADLGFGYEADFGKNHLRLEPYLQLPVKGIGVGVLPVKTAGLRIAFTRSEH